MASQAISADLDFANGLYRKEKYALAAEEYEQYLASKPTGTQAVEARFYLGECYLQLGRVNEASAAFGAVVDQSASLPATSDVSPQSLFRLGQLALQSRQYPLAKERLSLFRQQFPKHSRRPLADQYLGEALIELNEFGPAQSLLDELAKGSPEASIADRVELLLARLDDRRGKADQAKTRYSALIEKWQAVPAKQSLAADASYALGIIALREKNNAQAAEIFRRALPWAGNSGLAAVIALQEVAALVNLPDPARADQRLRPLLANNLPAELLPQALYLNVRVAVLLKDKERTKTSLERLAKTPEGSSWLSQSQTAVADALLADTERPAADRAQEIEAIAASSATPSTRARLAYLAAVAYVEAKDFASVLRLAGPLAESAPPDQKKLIDYLLGVAHFQTRQWEQAYPRLLSSVGQTPHDAAAVLMAGQAVLRQNSSAALALLPGIVDQLFSQGEGGGSLRLLGEEAFRLEQFDRAKDLFQKALSHPKPDRPRVDLALGWTFSRLQQWDAAIASFSAASDAAAADSEEKAEAIYMLAHSRDQKGDSSAAEADYARVYRDFPKSRWRWSAGQRWSKLLLKQAKKEEADHVLQDLATSATTPTEKASALADRAWLLLDQGKTSEAREILLSISSISGGGPSVPRACIKLAEILAAEKNPSQAMTYLDQATAVGVPETLQPAWHYRRGLVLKDLGKTEEAKAEWATVLSHPTAGSFAPAALFSLGEIAFESDAQKSISMFDELAARPDAGTYRSVARLRACQAMLKLGDGPAAAKRAEELIADHPDQATREEAIYVRARVHQQKAEFDQARALYQSIIGPDRTETAAKAQFMLGETFFLQEKWDEAIKAFLKVNILYAIPEWQSLALVEMGKCLVRKQEPAEARQAFEEVVAKFGSLPAAQEAKKQLDLMNASKSSAKE